MSTVERLQHWRDSGAITSAQFDAIAAIVRKERFSIFVELHALLYLGVLSFVAGLGWTVQKYFSSLGDAAILIGLSTLLALSLYYCFSRAPAWSNARVESPHLAFDYVLYLACLVFVAELGYIESRFQLLGDNRDYYLLFSAALFFAFAYRFDNRFVLSLALSTLAAWFGVKISGFRVVPNGPLRFAAIAYGAVIALAGTWLSRLEIKKHFLETYLHVAANVLFIAFLSGVFERDGEWLYFAGLMAMVVISIHAGVRFRHFAFVVYGTVYGYIGVSSEILRNMRGSTAELLYVVISGTIVIASIALLARRFGGEE